MGDYSGLMNQFKSDFGDVQNRFREFSQTGGYSPEDLANIRARAISPTRAVYANAQANIDRQRGLQGGYSPNYTAATAKMSRDLSQNISDTNTNANAAIAEMVQRGKLSGLQGLGQTTAQGAGALTGLFGQTPGMASMFGNQQANAMDQWLNATGMQNQLGLGLIGNQIQAGQLPGKWEQGFGRVKDIAGMGAGLISGFSGMGGGMPGGGYTGMYEVGGGG
jgi:hypothetical protein